MFNLIFSSETVLNGLFTFSLNLFTFFSVTFCVSIIVSKNPIVSVLFLIGLFFCIAIYLISVGLKFLGLSYLLVYVGAVSILFLFILMLINIRVSELTSYSKNSILLVLLTGLFFTSILINVIPNEFNSIGIKQKTYYVNNNTWEGSLTTLSDISSLGNVMYSNLSIWLVLTSTILILAMAGIMVITIKDNNTYSSVNVGNKNNITTINSRIISPYLPSLEPSKFIDKSIDKSMDKSSSKNVSKNTSSSVKDFTNNNSENNLNDNVSPALDTELSKDYSETIKESIQYIKEYTLKELNNKGLDSSKFIDWFNNLLDSRKEYYVFNFEAIIPDYLFDISTSSFYFNSIPGYSCVCLQLFILIRKFFPVLVALVMNMYFLGLSFLQPNIDQFLEWLCSNAFTRFVSYYLHLGINLLRNFDFTNDSIANNRITVAIWEKIISNVERIYRMVTSNTYNEDMTRLTWDEYKYLDLFIQPRSYEDPVISDNYDLFRNNIVDPQDEDNSRIISTEILRKVLSNINNRKIKILHDFLKSKLQFYDSIRN